MEMQVTMENNKLIAEFMGLSIKEGVSYYTDEDDMFPMNIEVDKPYLPYDKSWDWLMPVVKEVIQEDYDFLVFEELKYQLWRVDIDAVYSAVVEFIKEYNNLK